MDRITEFIDPTLGIDIDPMVYTLSEMKEMSKRNSRLVKEIKEYGILLAGDNRILEEF